MQNPKEIVYAFISDYYQWNNIAMNLKEKETNNSGEAMKEAQAQYQKLLDKYCLPGFKGEPIAFGSESSHETEKEVVVTEEITEDKAIIKTKHKGLYNFVLDYEYRFIKKESRWYLEAVDYVDSEGKYPSL